MRIADEPIWISARAAAIGPQPVATRERAIRLGLGPFVVGGGRKCDAAFRMIEPPDSSGRIGLGQRTAGRRQHCKQREVAKRKTKQMAGRHIQ